MTVTGRLIPLSQHKGPILELTQKDKTAIMRLNKRVRACAYRLENYYADMNTPWITERDRGVCRRKIDDIVNKISQLKNEIRDIKINRYEKQKLDCVV